MLDGGGIPGKGSPGPKDKCDGNPHARSVLVVRLTLVVVLLSRSRSRPWFSFDENMV